MCFFVLAIISLLLAVVNSLAVAVMSVSTLSLSMMDMEIVLNFLDEVLQGERVGSLNREAEGSAPDLGCHDTEGARHTEEDCVVVKLVEAVVHQEGAGTGINVGPGVGYLASCLEHLRNDFVASLNEVHKVIILDILVSKLELAHEARICLTEDGVTISWDYFARCKSVLNILSNIILIPVLSELSLEIEQELQAFLVSKAVKRSSKTVHTSGEGEVRVGQGRTDEVSSMSAHVATFMITILKEG